MTTPEIKARFTAAFPGVLEPEPEPEPNRLPWYLWHWCLRCENGSPCWRCWLNRVTGRTPGWE